MRTARAPLGLAAAALALLAGAVLAEDSEAGLGARLQAIPAPKLVAFFAGLLLILVYAMRGFLVDCDKVFLVDFHCFAIPSSLKAGTQKFLDTVRKTKDITDEDVAFYKSTLEQAGISGEAGLSESILAMQDGKVSKSLASVHAESEMVLFDVAEHAIRKSCVQPKEIDIVIVACSFYTPTPSMAAMLVNKHRLRSDVLTYNLSGMGASADVIAVDMARHLLRALPDATALVVAHENVTAHWYPGRDRAMMLSNGLLRLGGAAAILSNRPSHAGRAKYELLHTVRQHLATQPDAFDCMGLTEDADRTPGVFVRPNVLDVTAKAVQANARALAPKLLLPAELVKSADGKATLPDFSKTFQHFLLHVGAPGVADCLQAALRLPAAALQPARNTFQRFGDTSAASTWYSLAQVESAGRVRKGDRLWQLSHGCGFKCNSAVWRALRDVHEQHACWQ